MAKARKFGKAEVEVSINDRVRSGLQAIEGRLKSFGAGVAKLGAGLAALGGSGAALFGGASKSFAAAGDDIEKMAARTGIAAETLSALSFAAGQSGASIEAVEKGVRRMQQTIIGAADGTTSQVEALEALGLSVEQFQGLNPQQQFETFAEALSKIQDPTERAARAMDIFGRSGTELLPMFANGAKGIRDLTKEASDLGHVLTTEDAAAAAALTDALGRITAAMKGVVMQIGAALAPMLTRAANVIAQVGAVVVSFVKNNRGLVQVLAVASAAVAALGTALVTAGGAMMALGSAVGMVSALFTPLGAIIAGVSAALATIGGLFIATAIKTGGLTRSLGYLKALFLELKPVFDQVMQGIGNALRSGDMELAAKIMFAGLEVVFYKGAQKLMQTMAKLAAEAAAVFVKLRDDIATGRILFGGGGLSAAGNFLSGASFSKGAADAQNRLNALTAQARNQAGAAGLGRGPGGGQAGRAKELGVIAENAQRQTRLQQKLLRERMGFR